MLTPQTTQYMLAPCAAATALTMQGKFPAPTIAADDDKDDDDHSLSQGTPAVATMARCRRPSLLPAMHFNGNLVNARGQRLPRTTTTISPSVAVYPRPTTARLGPPLCAAGPPSKDERRNPATARRSQPRHCRRPKNAPTTLPSPSLPVADAPATRCQPTSTPKRQGTPAVALSSHRCQPTRTLTMPWHATAAALSPRQRCQHQHKSDAMGNNALEK